MRTIRAPGRAAIVFAVILVFVVGMACGAMIGVALSRQFAG